MTAFRLSRAAAPLGLAAALTLGLTAVLAQTPPAAGPPPPGLHRPDGAMREHMRERMEHHRAEVIADWTTVLKLSPAQAQALQAAMTPPKRPGGAWGKRAPGAPGDETTLQRLDHMQAGMAERQGHMRERLAAMRAFYTSLSPDQQRTYDAVTRLSHGGHHRRGGWGGHGMGGGRGEGGGWGGSGRQGPPPPPGE